MRRLPNVDSAQTTPQTDPATTRSSQQGRPPSEGEQQGSTEGQQPTTLGDDELLAEAPRAWYEWVYPSSWLLPPVWESSFEIGVDGSEGNSTTLSVRTGANLKRSVESSELGIDMTYVKATADSRETKHNAQLAARHDWLLGESPWSLFAKTQLEYDEFKAYDLRLTTNTGVGYQLIATESTQLKGRLGSGVSHEFRGPDDRWVPEAVFGVDFEQQFSDRQRMHATVDYLPEWENFHDYRVHTDCGWAFLVNESTNMNLKLGIVQRYDSTPNGRKPNDLDFSLTLLWKL